MNPEAPENTSAASGGSSFPTTRWSMVVNAGADATSISRTALEDLCRHYWYPLYTFVRRQGRTHHEAEDCTQEFLSRLLATEGVARARPERGRFRTFMLAALRNFLISEWRKDHADKRGGGEQPLPLEFDTAEQRFSLEPADPNLTPEQAYDRSWAVDMISRAIAGLRTEYEASGRGDLFEAMSPLLADNVAADSHAQIAGRLGMTTHALTMAAHRLRTRLSERVRIEVSQTVAEGADVDAELQHLIAALRTPAP